MSCRTVVANERKKVMYVRKHGKKWQCLVRMKGISVSQSFYSKSEASNCGKDKFYDYIRPKESCMKEIIKNIK